MKNFLRESAGKFGLMDGVMVVGVGLIVIGLGMGLKKERKKEVVEMAAPTEVVARKIMVDVAGAVVKPGVYEALDGERVVEMLAKAGGLALEADREWVEANVNRAGKVTDGMKIYIPVKGGGGRLGVGGVLGVKSEIINLNSATKEELEKLPGVGPVLAERILEYRQKIGGFKNIGELKLVEGVGEKMWLKIKDKAGI